MLLYLYLNYLNILSNIEQQKHHMKTADKRQLFQAKVTFGDDSNSPELSKLNLKFTFGVENKQLRQEMTKKFQNGLEEDIFIKIVFEVAEGRQKQAVQYLQKGMNSTNQHNLNLIQIFLKRPNRLGNVFLESQKGRVIVYYILYGYQNVRQNDRKALESMLSTGSHPEINLQLLIKGVESQGFKKQVVIDPNYSELNVNVMSTPQQIAKILQSGEIFSRNPVSQMMCRGMRKIKLKAKFNIFQKMLKMYNQIAEKKEVFESKKNIMKNYRLLNKVVTATISWKKVGLFEIKVNFEKENYFHLILKAVKEFLQKK